jgi:hypothetical protein
VVPLSGTKVKDFFKLGVRFKLGNGAKIKLWLDWWIGDGPLCDCFPGILDIAVEQNIFVNRALVGNEWRTRLGRTLSDDSLRQWNDPDSVSWALEGSGIFSSHSLHLKLNQGASVAHAKDI